VREQRPAIDRRVERHHHGRDPQVGELAAVHHRDVGGRRAGDDPPAARRAGRIEPDRRGHVAERAQRLLDERDRGGQVGLALVREQSHLAGAYRRIALSSRCAGRQLDGRPGTTVGG
jgi:hypothetical protein